MKAQPWRKRHPERYRAAALERHLFRVFGLTVLEYRALAYSQGGVCAICHRPEPQPGRRLAVDHDHVTGRVRGLLCSLCNQGLGMFRDDPEALLGAITYVA